MLEIRYASKAKVRELHRILTLKLVDSRNYASLGHTYKSNSLALYGCSDCMVLQIILKEFLCHKLILALSLGAF